MKHKLFISMLVLIFSAMPSFGITLQAETDAYDGSSHEGSDHIQVIPDQNVTSNFVMKALAGRFEEEGAIESDRAVRALEPHNERDSLLNGGFEDLDVKPEGWTVVNGHLNSVESTTEQVYSGDYSVKLTDMSSSTAADLRSNKVPVTPGGNLRGNCFFIQR